MAKYGDMVVAGIGVAMKVTMITGMICIGLRYGKLQVIYEECRRKNSLHIVWLFLLAVLLHLHSAIQ